MCQKGKQQKNGSKMVNRQHNNNNKTVHPRHSMSNNTSQLQAGFTLIEMLVVVSLTVLLMIAASSLFMTSLIGNTKTTLEQLVKSEGEYALNQMEFLIRNSVALVDNQTDPTSETICEMNMDAIGLKSIDNQVTILGKTQIGGIDKISSNSAYLTSDSVTLLSGPTFDCQKSSDGTTRYVGIKFELRKGDPGVDDIREVVQQEFSSGVTIRTF